MTEPLMSVYPSAVWQTGGFYRRDPMFGTQGETWSFWTDDGLCSCGRGCSFWSSLFPPLPPGLEFPPEPGEERCVADPLPRPKRRAFKTTGYFGRFVTAWRLSTLTPPRPPWWNFRRAAYLVPPPVEPPSVGELNELFNKAFVRAEIVDDETH